MSKEKNRKRPPRSVESDDGFGLKSLRGGAYHRHFKGYSEYTVTDEHGKSRIQRVYTGIYYVPPLNKAQYRGRKWLYLLLYLASFVLFAACAAIPAAANSSWYVAVGQVPYLLCMFWSAVTLYCYAAAPVPLMEGDWESGSRALIRSTTAGTCSTVFAAFMILLHLVLNPDSWGMQLLELAGFLACGAVLLLIRQLESNLSYVEKPSEKSVPPDATQIN